MKTTARKSITTGLVALFAFAVFTLLVRTTDLNTLPPVNNYVGFASINSWFHGLTGVNMALYTVTDWLSIVPLTVCLIHGFAGLIQLIQRKSIFRVDARILISGVYYAVVIRFFVLFEAFPVNYRPVLINGVSEASYPSSTTLLILTVMPVVPFIHCRKSGRKQLNKAIHIATYVFTIFMVTARLFSGVHWLTDIIGGMLLSTGLFYIYKGAILIYDNKQTP